MRRENWGERGAALGPLE